MWLDLIQYIVWNIFSKVGFNSVQNTGKWLDFSFFHTLFSQDEGGCWQWMYEGRNGWWLYDERTSQEIEKSFKNNELRCELLIAGFLYIVGKLALIKWVLSKSFLSDFEHMLQYRRNDPSRRRKIKRDASSAPKKGVAGLRMEAGQEEDISTALDTLNINSDTVSDEHHQHQE